MIFAKITISNYVALSLSEAASLRAQIHNAGRNWLLSGTKEANNDHTSIGLRCGSYLLDSSQGYEQAGDYQQTQAEQLYRFVDSETNYSERELSMLLRSIEHNEETARLEYFNDIRACRRRKVVDATTTPIQKLFTLPDHYLLFDFRATVSRIRRLIYRRGMMLMDAFRVFDADRNNLLNCSELYGGITWLDFEVEPAEIHQMMHYGHRNESPLGLLTANEFVLIFTDPRAAEDPDNKEFQALVANEEDEEGEGKAVADTVPPRPMEEIHQVISEKKKDKSLEERMFAKVKVRRVKVQKFEKVWSTEGTTSRNALTIYKPKIVDSWGKMTINIGHYCVDAAGPGWENPNSKSPFYTIEFSDNSSLLFGTSENIKLVFERLCPHPLKYSQVWKKELDNNSLYVWKPIPPSDEYVAIGMLTTTDAKEPSVELTRCVPAGWVVPHTVVPHRYWDDAGTGGKQGSMWVGDDFGLLTAAASLELPNRKFCALWKSEFYCSDRVSEVKWDHDSNTKNCYLCDCNFTLLNRRHHCRICGHIFCDNCSKYRVTLTSKNGKKTKKVRVCEVCVDSPVLPELPDN